MWDRSAKLWALPLLLLLSGCSRNLGDDRYTLFWAVPPLVIFGVLGMYGVYWHRKDQLARWDLRVDPLPPDGRASVVLISGIAVAATVGFGVLNGVTNGVDGWQKLQNVSVWLVTTAIAAGLAIFFGRMLAERGYSRKGN